VARILDQALSNVASATSGLNALGAGAASRAIRDEQARRPRAAKAATVRWEEGI
jgi:hypothetical protein